MTEHLPTYHYGWAVVKMIGALIGVLIVMGLALKGLKKIQGSRGIAPGAIQVIGGVSLGSRRSLLFVKIGSSLYVLGSTESSLTLLKNIDDPEEIRKITEFPSSTPPLSFSQLLRPLFTLKSSPEPFPKPGEKG
ncbi:MAG: FliO/MopB family protein [bacterium]